MGGGSSAGGGASASSSAGVSSAGGSSSASASSSGPPPDDVPYPGCVRNATALDYTFCITDGWYISGGKLRDETGHAVATVTCPIGEGNFQGLSLVKEGRTYTRYSATRGADLWVGTPTEGGPVSLRIVFLHLHDLNSWFGDNYQDIGQSCQIKSLEPTLHEELFRTMFISIF